MRMQTGNSGFTPQNITPPDSRLRHFVVFIAKLPPSGKSPSVALSRALKKFFFILHT
jgi:hypothetical protein